MEVSTTGGWLRRLWAACWARPRVASAVVVTLIAGAVAEVSVPVAAKQALDDARAGNVHAITAVTVVLVALAVIRFGTAVGRRWIAGRLALDVQHEIRVSLLSALHRYDGRGQDALRTGQVVSRSISDLQLVQGFLAIAPMSMMQLLLAVLAAAVMLVLSPPLALVSLLTVPAITLVVYRTSPRLHAATWSAQQHTADLAQHVEETVTGVRVVKGFGQESRMVGVLEQHARRLYGERMRAARIAARFQPTVSAIPQLGMVAVIALGGLLALRGTIGIGTFLAFAAYITMLAGSTRVVAGVIVQAQLTRAAAERVFAVIDEAPDTVDPPTPQPVPEGPLGIELDSVTFGFDPQRPVLREFDLSVRAGETVAIIGPAGSGKSTLALLLPRFYSPDSGRICLRGTNGEVDLARARASEVRAAIGVVFDEPFLYSDTVSANIALGRPDATAQEIRRAAELAAAHEFIAALPDGYDTVVGERGLTLSGGQRQRLALARALLADPRVLILDDATSAVDAVTEAAIFEGLRSGRTERTTIILAHRESTLTHADRVIRLPEPDHPAITNLWPDADGITAGDLHNTAPTRTNGSAPERAARASMRPTGSAPHRPSTPTDHTEPTSPVPSPAPRSSLTANGDSIGEQRTMANPAHRQLDDLPALQPRHADTDIPPELRAALSRLGPPDESPGTDASEHQRPEPNFRLLRLLRPVRWLLAILVTLLALEGATGVAFPMVTRYALDHGVAGRSAAVLAGAALVALILTGASWLNERVGSMISARGGERLLYGLRIRSFAHLQRLGLDYYERELSGRIMTRMTTDIDALSTFLQTGLTTALIGIATVAGVLVALVFSNARLALVVLVALPLLIIATLIFRKISASAYSASRERVATVNADFQEKVGGLRTTQAYRHEPHATQRFTDYSEDYRRARLRAQKAIAIYFGFIVAWADLAQAAVVYVGARDIAHGITTPGTLVAFVLYLGLLINPIVQLSQVFDGYQQASVGLRRIAALLRTPSSISPDPAEPVITPPGHAADVEFDTVRFRYQGAPTDALTDVSLRIPAGSSLALVGETGAGKSTIVKLLARLYDLPPEDPSPAGSRDLTAARPDGSGADPLTAAAHLGSNPGADGAHRHDGIDPIGDTLLPHSGPLRDGRTPHPTGTILVDGADVRDYRLADYRARLGVVPQEAHLFTGDIASNIAFGRPTATPNQVERAANTVGALEMIAGLPLGMRQPVGEGGRGLSAGQRQLIALARAELVDPDLLLLDEATAVLDPDSEEKVLAASSTMTRGRTAVIVAHRLATAARADRIAVVAAGRIAEIGTHAELVEAGGIYARLWEAAGASEGIFST